MIHLYLRVRFAVYMATAPIRDWWWDLTTPEAKKNTWLIARIDKIMQDPSIAYEIKQQLLAVKRCLQEMDKGNAR